MSLLVVMLMIIKPTILKKAMVAYNNVYRRILMSNEVLGMFAIYVNNNIDAFTVLIHKNIDSFRTGLLCCDKKLISCIATSVLFIFNSSHSAK